MKCAPFYTLKEFKPGVDRLGHRCKIIGLCGGGDGSAIDHLVGEVDGVGLFVQVGHAGMLLKESVGGVARF